MNTLTDWTESERSLWKAFEDDLLAAAELPENRSFLAGLLDQWFPFFMAQFAARPEPGNAGALKARAPACPDRNDDSSSKHLELLLRECLKLKAEIVMLGLQLQPKDRITSG
ncbi:MAG: hypothetical protein U1E76_23645 [Planctomycetota bacterium]